MKTMLRTMKNQKNGIPKDVLAVFESIVQTYSENECDNRFMEAMGEHLAEKQRFTLWEKHGGCQGTGQNKVRKAFALEHADKPLSVRLELYVNTFIKDYTGKTQSITLNEEKNTITVIFACDECYRHTLKGKLTAPFMLYNERCAGGRMYALEKALGIKLKIHSIDIPQLGVSKESPCSYTFNIVE
ncbi:hypothetical protein [Kineothrix sp. MB12-C1]|uniref:hypothetical protein n=1 Tax=Kineothrix sp. MB12-C1 TaxID=3070215 RepID=UPI0027D337AD|nr:hypothetical protein [Kineothrix sp. MB12-C1]WMC93570.1 hypothetical protein RBB56_04620 [Kineothrix sp. MB12-C1]